MLKILLSILTFLIIYVMFATPSTLFYIGISFLKLACLGKVAVAGDTFVFVGLVYLLAGISFLYINGSLLVQIIKNGKIRVDFKTANKLFVFYSVVSFLIGMSLAFYQSFPFSCMKSPDFIMLTVSMSVLVVVVFFNAVTKESRKGG